MKNKFLNILLILGVLTTEGLFLTQYVYAEEEIAKEIIENHGGTINIQSEKNRGSIVTVKLRSDIIN